VTPPGGVSDADAKAAASSAVSSAEIILTFDRATVDLDALQRSAYAVAAEMTVDIHASGADYICTIFPRRKDSNEDEIKHRFRAEVNDQVLRARIAKETEPLRNLVFALAFSQTGLAEGEETAE
jgi:His-Xaa-Ser system protein HxsD